MVVATQIRMCRMGACSTPIPSALARHNVCLTHYLDEVFTRVSAIQALCERGEHPDSRSLNWLSQQGDLAVTLLSGDGPSSQDDRTRLLDLLLCLANLHESLRRSQNAAKPKPEVP